MTEKVLLALGSNLDNPIRQIQTCLQEIAKLPDSRLIKCSSLYSSSPRGPQDQHDYVNAAALIETSLTPEDLLEQTQTIENSMGRIKTRRWGERVIDIDIAFYGAQQVSSRSPDLTIPHAEALIRDFVVIPCLEISEYWQLPDGTLLQDAAAQCVQHNLHKIDANLACP